MQKLRVNQAELLEPKNIKQLLQKNIGTVKISLDKRRDTVQLSKREVSVEVKPHQKESYIEVSASRPILSTKMILLLVALAIVGVGLSYIGIEFSSIGGLALIGFSILLVGGLWYRERKEKQQLSKRLVASVEEVINWENTIN